MTNQTWPCFSGTSQIYTGQVSILHGTKNTEPCLTGHPVYKKAGTFLKIQGDQSNMAFISNFKIFGFSLARFLEI